jgi:3D (Asp-Asp-Asp) domain-containing protein
LSVLVVIELLSIISEKVKDMLSLTDTELWLSVGEIEETVGAVVSMTIDLFAPSEPEAPGYGNVRVASLEALSRMVPLFIDREPVAL